MATITDKRLKVIDKKAYYERVKRYSLSTLDILDSLIDEVSYINRNLYILQALKMANSIEDIIYFSRFREKELAELYAKREIDSLGISKNTAKAHFRKIINSYPSTDLQDLQKTRVGAYKEALYLEDGIIKIHCLIVKTIWDRKVLAFAASSFTLKVENVIDAINTLFYKVPFTMERFNSLFNITPDGKIELKPEAKEISFFTKYYA